MSCADSGPFDGGTYNNPVIVEPTVTGGEFTNPTLDGAVHMTPAAAQTMLADLQEVSPIPESGKPQELLGEELPTMIVGEDRTVILGKPFKWIKCGDGCIPVFRMGN